MRCRQTIGGWLSSFTLICFTVGILLAIHSPVLASTSSRQFSQITDIIEVSPPESIQKLRAKIDLYQPQVKILSPAAEQLIKDDSVSVRFEVKDLPIFKDAELGLGPHLNVLLDNQPAQEVYDLSQPIVFNNLEPGTHTIRAVATRPWSESFKNSGAFAQTTFHIFTKTEDNHPLSDRPLLTYGQPEGVFGTNTVLIDFFLSNLPATNSNLANWQAQVSVNGSKFHVDDWQPLYIQGLKPGKNWVQIQLTDRHDLKIENAFNDTIRIVELEENGNDTLSKLIRGDLSALDAGGIVDPHYKRPQPSVKPTSPQPSSAPTAEPIPVPVKPQKSEIPKSELAPTPTLKKPSQVSTPKPKGAQSSSSKSSPATSVSPSKSVETTPESIQKQPERLVKPTTPSQKEQKSTSEKPKRKASSPPQTTAPSPVQKESMDIQNKMEGTDSAKSKSFEVKTPKPKTKIDEKTQLPLQKEQSSPKSSIKTLQPQAAEKLRVIEKPTPKLVEKAPRPNLDTTQSSPIPSVPTEVDQDKVPMSVTGKSSAMPNSSVKRKATQQDEHSTLKTIFTKFWQQVRPSQGATKPSQPASTTGEKGPSKTVKPDLTPAPSSTSTNTMEPKSTQNFNTPPTKTARPSSKTVEPKPTPFFSPPSGNEVESNPSSANAENKTIAPPSQQPVKPQTSVPTPPSSRPKTTEQPKPSTSVPKAAESSQKSAVKDRPEKTQPTISAPAQKSGNGNSSVFSALRDQWKRKQKGAVPAVDKPHESLKATTSPNSVNSATTKEKPTPSSATTLPQTSKPDKSSAGPSIDNQTKQEVAQPSTTSKVKSKSTDSALSSLRDRWQRQKQLMSATEKTKSSPVPPTPEKSTDTIGAVKTLPSQDQAAHSTQSSTPKTEQKKPFARPSALNTVQKPAVTKPNVQRTVKAQDNTKTSAASQPTSQPEQTESVFSSLRDRWQQQKQLMNTPEEKTTVSTPKPEPTPAKPSKTTKQIPAIEKTPVPSSKSSSSTVPKSIPKKSESVKEKANPAAANPASSVFSSFRDRWQQQKQLTAPAMKEKGAPTPTPASQKSSNQTVAAPQPVSPSKPKTPSPSNSTNQGGKQSAAAPPKGKAQKQVQTPEPVTFDPSAYYRRFFSGQMNGTAPKPENVSPSSP